jgi:hypothetical protein
LLDAKYGKDSNSQIPDSIGPKWREVTSPIRGRKGGGVKKRTRSINKGRRRWWKIQFGINQQGIYHDEKEEGK